MAGSQEPRSRGRSRSETSPPSRGHAPSPGPRANLRPRAAAEASSERARSERASHGLSLGLGIQKSVSSLKQVKYVTKHIHIYICIHIYIYICIDIYIYIYKHIYIYVYGREPSTMEQHSVFLQSFYEERRKGSSWGPDHIYIYMNRFNDTKQVSYFVKLNCSYC